jgi:hypothetical protein
LRCGACAACFARRLAGALDPVAVSHNLGPGGTPAPPTPAQQTYDQAQQVAPTPAQVQHQQAAAANKAQSYAQQQRGSADRGHRPAWRFPRRGDAGLGSAA